MILKIEIEWASIVHDECVCVCVISQLLSDDSM